MATKVRILVLRQACSTLFSVSLGQPEQIRSPVHSRAVTLTPRVGPAAKPTTGGSLFPTTEGRESTSKAVPSIRICSCTIEAASR